MADGPLPPLLLQKVKMLVSRYPVLIGEQSFSQYFQKMFRECLEPSALGHSSISSLLYCLASARVIVLTLENNAMTVRPSKETIVEMKDFGENCTLTELDSIKSTERAVLPPQDCVLKYTLAVEELPVGMKEGQTFPVVITQVESPTKFWFNLCGQLDKVKKVMDKMDELYKGKKGEKYLINTTEQLKPGHMVAATYKNQGYHRALVTEVVSSTVVKLFYVDYGTVENRKIKHCRFICKVFTSLPGQAIQARLWGVGPVGGGKAWERDNKARDKLVELTDTLEGCLVAIIKAGVTRMEVIVKGDEELEEERGLALSLLDILVGDEGSDIATEMVMEGVAEWEVQDVEEEVVVGGYEDAVTKVKYQFPEFYDKEAPVVKRSGKSKLDRNDEVQKKDSEVLTPSPYLQLLRVHEENLRRLVKILEVEEEGGTDVEDGSKRAKMWARKRNLEEIRKKREEREELELINLIDRELAL